MAEYFLRFVVEHEAENLVVDNAFYLFGGAAQQLFDIKDRAGLAADFVQQQQRVRLLADALEEPGVFNGDGEAAGEEGENPLLIRREISQVAALHVQNADNFALQHQGDGKLGANIIDGIDVTRIVGGV